MAPVETSLAAEAIKSLVASGPVALILGVMCYLLWKQNQEMHTRLEQQQDRMIRLAVRVQRTVEALAGIRGLTAVEEELDSADRDSAEGDRNGYKGRDRS